MQVTHGTHVHSDAKNLLKVVLHPTQIKQSGMCGGVYQQIKITILPIFAPRGRTKHAHVFNPRILSDS